MKILKISPGEHPKTIEIDDSLESMQAVVGGCIQPIYPFDEPVALVCHEEGKLIDLPANRILIDEDGNILDIICGTFFLCAAPPDEENFAGLSDEQIEKFANMFRDSVVVLQE